MPDDLYQVRCYYPASEWSHEHDERIERHVGQNLKCSKKDGVYRMLIFEVCGMTDAQAMRWKLVSEAYHVHVREV